MQLAVGRLGIITKLTLTIVPNIQILRSLQQMSTQDFIDQIRDTQLQYAQALEDGSLEEQAAALQTLDETQVSVHACCYA